jgi:hypothetical protein
LYPYCCKQEAMLVLLLFAVPSVLAPANAHYNM